MKEKDLEKTELNSEKSKKRKRCCRRPTLCEVLLGQVFNRNLARGKLRPLHGLERYHVGIYLKTHLSSDSSMGIGCSFCVFDGSTGPRRFEPK